MSVRIGVLFVLLFIFIHVLLTSAQNQDIVYLQALMDNLHNTPPNWVGSDPCVEKWDGISCIESRVTSITLSSIGLSGELSGDIGQLSELQTLDLSYNKDLTGSLTPDIGNLKKLSNLILVGCGFNGPLPETLGSLTQLGYLALNSNGFTGSIPPSIGNLSKLYWLDLADNKLSGPIPVSKGPTPGLDQLVNIKHFHFGKNKLSGEIPPRLFSSKMSLKHVLFEENQLTGTVPLTLGLVQNLEVLRLDRNLLSGEVPSNINNLTSLNQLYLSNNNFEGPLPNLTGMKILNYLDMSNNSFQPSEIPPWLSSLQSLTTLMMQDTGLIGEVPVDLFSIPQIETLVLRNNELNGTLDFGASYSNHLHFIDMTNNLISGYTERSRYSADLILISNPICRESDTTASYCDPLIDSNSSYSTPQNNCIPETTCTSDQVSSPNCKCSYPYTGTLTFRAPSFSNLGNSTIYTSLRSSIMVSFESNHLPVDSLSLSQPTKNSDDYLEINLAIFPSGGERFNRSGISQIGFILSNQTYKPPHSFGPYFFLGHNYDFFSDAPKRKGKSIGIGVTIGVVVGGCVLVILLIIAGIYAFREKGRAERATKKNSPFASWDPDKGGGDCPQLKGARSFTYEELKTCTNNFAITANIGSGGYGMVYRGTLPKWAIGEQMLVYEFIVNGTLKDSLSGRSGIRLDWMRRLKIILGAARGDADRTHVTTQVKGTMGYMDPEYYMTQQLTEKSDVYSFGIVMLELITARNPIEKGKYIVREVKEAMDREKDLYNLREVLDPIIGLTHELQGLERFVDIALRCVEDTGNQRPRMSEVVKEIESIMELAGFNPNAESASASESYEGKSKGSGHPYLNESLFSYSGGLLDSNLEAK
ncbi:unnamed protein product [Lactuca virosa]|uniref:non-specific serine/threonine protein kinase n=1 Tax=Lactuca virosa TaxID=75947 RepID=A0AAU9P281_9ASTR|nr:unnamed protein product [Lactuca virosa]